MAEENYSSNLIINYLPQSMTDGELHSMFVTIGPVKSCRVMKDFKTNYSFGFGFVNYTRPEDAQKAIERLDGIEILNKRIKVSFARPSGENIKDTNLYVTSLPKDFTEQDLRALFEPFGQIVQMNMLREKATKLPTGRAFVRYNQREEAQRAIGVLHGTVPEGGAEPLNVRVAEEHGKRKAAYYAGWQAGLQSQRPRPPPLVGQPSPPIQVQRGGRGGRGGAMRGRSFANVDFGAGRGAIRAASAPGPIRRGRYQQRPNPLAFGIGGSHDYSPFAFGLGAMQNNGYSAF